MSCFRRVGRVFQPALLDLSARRRSLRRPSQRARPPQVGRSGDAHLSILSLDVYATGEPVPIV
jgi:hypothetical protein